MCRKSELLVQIFDMEKELMRRALSLCNGNDADSSDLVQDTIVKAMLNEEKFERGTNLRAWLYTIMFHIFVNRHRKKKRIEEIHNAHASWIMTALEGGTTHHDMASSMEVASVLDLLESNLSKVFFEVLVAVDVEGLSYRETSDRLGVPVGTVMSRLFRARKKSKDLLLNEYDLDVLVKMVGSDALNL
jgi:RNA polymerase sigma-70 factor, ECF subfamily